MVKEYSQLDLDNFDKIKISQKKNLVLMAGDLYLFNPAILKIKDLIKNNYI